MKQNALITTAAILMAVFVMACVCPSFTAWVEMTRASLVIRLTNPEKPISSEKIYSAVTTGAEGCSAETLREYYDTVAKALYSKSANTVTYSWADDVLYYSRLSTVLETSQGYVEVVASHNNDNNCVAVIFSAHPFSHQGRANMEKQDGYGLPQGFFPNLPLTH
ncbi:hypothetical protein [Prosthecobacter vanneervenii]|uniref:Lipoprotein n=1 Tax=Prosthecobacter vanneervenii TaxID=48466 RepID=A0A7W8DK15_9BACT|nr:hypothetical protein [Prosthecobacter vanneervenii]MBB5032748.1 hypothetical protein [Prosthecobacter vanneervenii]